MDKIDKILLEDVARVMAVADLENIVDEADIYLIGQSHGKHLSKIQASSKIRNTRKFQNNISKQYNKSFLPNN